MIVSRSPRTRFVAFKSAGALWLVGASLGVGVSWLLVVPAAAYVLLGSAALASTAGRTARTATLLWAVAVVLVALAAIPSGVGAVLLGLVFGSLLFGVWFATGWLLVHAVGRDDVAARGGTSPPGDRVR
ncbi:hypothetical protein [Nocardioides plantarum]|uniref:Uncharacterized protein n=1 Tax=Nocardioides plantarum TaxID=29299 RepID=A0ABV5K6H8_9ACTN|nr:hypothetical protein [Nocardioides plantarum]